MKIVEVLCARLLIPSVLSSLLLFLFIYFIFTLLQSRKSWHACCFWIPWQNLASVTANLRGMRSR